MLDIYFQWQIVYCHSAPRDYPCGAWKLNYGNFMKSMEIQLQLKLVLWSIIEIDPLRLIQLKFIG